MIFDITKENYNKTLNNLQNAGFKIDTVPFEFGNMQINQKLKTPSTGENENENENTASTTNEVERTSLTIELPLPDANKKLDDYASVMLWFNSVDGYMSLSLPFNTAEYPENITNPTEDQIKRITYKVYGSGSGKFILKASVTNDDYSYFDLLEDSDCYLTFLSTDNFRFNYKETVVVESLSTLFNLCTTEDSKDLADSILGEKTNLIAADYDSESQIAGCYKLSACEPYNTDETEIVYDANTLTYSYKGCAYKATALPTYGKRYTVKQFGAVGYTQAELDGMTDSEKGNIAASNAAALNNAANMCAQIGKEYNRAIELSFEPNLIYLLGSVVYFSSDTEFIGNNAIIRLFNNTNGIIVAFSNKRVLTADDDYGNVGFYDLTIEGRYGSSVPIADQAVHCASIDSYGNTISVLPKSVTFNNCKFTDFCFGIHINNSAYYDVPLYWTFDNCDFKTGMGFNLTGVKSLKLLNSHIDNCLSTDKFNHCIYISEKCSYLTVDNCLLENSAGGAIHQNYGHELKNSEFNHNNTFKNITIRSCQTGLNIGLTSKSINAENIYMYDVLRGIILNSCVDVEIKNIYATGSFYRRPRNYANGRERVFNSHIKLYESTENGLPVSDDAWTAIGIKGKVKAKISNGYFKFSSPTIGSSAYLTTDINGGNNGAREIDYVYEQHKDWFEDDFVEANVVFENCAFDSTYNNLYKSYKKENGIISSYCTSERSNSYVGVSVAQKITSNPNLEITYKNNIKFIRCKFEMNYDTVSKVFFYFKGNPKSVSTYSFESCNIFLYIEDYIAQQNKKLFGAYFSYAGKGANISLVNCNFRKNCLLYKALGNPKTECQYWANGDGETIISNCTEALFDYQLDDFPN